MSGKIGVVIVSYNSADELADCIKAVKSAAQNASLEPAVVVVDNNSKDKSVKMAEKSGALTIANKTNLGFSAGVNQGIKTAFKNGCEFILILNPDLIMSAKSLPAMLSALRSDPKIGAVGPSMVDKTGKPSNDNYYIKAPSWMSVSLFSTFLRPHALKHPFLVNSFWSDGDMTSSREVEQIPGACLLTSKSVLDKVGLLDEDFAIWFEDVEWCYRARKRGYKMWFCADAPVEHEGGTSFERWQSLDKAVTFYVSMKTFFNKHKPVSGILVRLALTVNSLALFIKNRDKSNLVFLKKFWLQKRGILPS